MLVTIYEPYRTNILDFLEKQLSSNENYILEKINKNQIKYNGMILSKYKAFNKKVKSGDILKIHEINIVIK